MYNRKILDCFKTQSGSMPALNIIRDIKCSYLQAVCSPNTSTLQFIELVGLSICQYNYGKHSAAYALFKNAMSLLNIQFLIRPLTEKTLYRLRKGKTDRPEEMFHIPLQQRYKVGTQRYSFPGLPCLYMGDSIEVCKEEVFGQTIELSNDYSIAQYVVTENKNPQVLDLSYFFDMDYDELDELERQSFFEILPLIAFCSMKCTYPEEETVRFKTEYIIPQMLLEYIMDTQPFGNDEIIGIKYRSVYHMHDIWEKKDATKKWNNYVFPARSSQPIGFSKTLQDAFTFVCFHC